MYNWLIKYRLAINQGLTRYMDMRITMKETYLLFPSEPIPPQRSPHLLLFLLLWIALHHVLQS